MIPLALRFLAAAGLSLGLSLLCERVARRAGWVAAPREDRWHRQPIPLLGGVAIALAVLLPLVLAGRDSREFLILSGIALAMAGVGLVDDLFTLTPQIKLVAQILLASLLLHFGFLLRLTSVPLLDVFLTLFWLVGMTNAFNLLDNMDGLSAGIALIAGGFRLVFFLWDGNPGGAGASAVFMGAVFGFLLRNFPPARIFMGDAGSFFLGFFLAGLSLSGGFPYSRGVAAVLLVPVLLLLVPIFDTTFVTITRLFSGRPMSQGGRDHTSHRLVVVGVSERWVLLFFYAIAATSGGVALLSYTVGFSNTVVVPALLILGLILLGVYLGRIHVVQTAEVPGPGAVLRLLADFPYKRHVLSVALDLVLVVLAYYTAFLLRFENEASGYVIEVFRSLPTLLITQLGALAVFGVYQGVWRYTDIRDLLRILKATLAGTISAVIVLLYLYRFEGFSRAVFILDWILLLTLVYGTRLSFRLLSELLRATPTAFRRVLIYGAGDGGELALREILSNQALRRTPVGFIDDDRSKHGTQIHGFPVLGDATRLEEIIQTHRIDEVMVATSKIRRERIQALQPVCARYGIAILRASIRLETLEQSAEWGPLADREPGP